MPDSDQSFVEKAREGNQAAFRRLVERHQSFVLRVAYRFVGAAGEAEDITQEAFIRLWRNLHRYNPEIKLTTWLYKIVANLCLDFLKSRHNRMAKHSNDMNSEVPGGVAADQSMIDKELRTAVEEQAATLSEKQRAVFILRDLEGVDMKEIADILLMDYHQVKSNLYYARKRIGERIALHYGTKKELEP